MSSSSDFSLSSTIKLTGEILMPRIHLGVYMTYGRETTTAVTHALNAGYRAIDSAEWYENEAEVGAAILKCVKGSNERGDAVAREDIWFTTKLKSNISYDDTRRKIRESIEECGLGYLDLYLLHSPYGGRRKREECWRAVTDAIKEGEVRVGGVSNFGVKHASLPSLSVIRCVLDAAAAPWLQPFPNYARQQLQELLAAAPEHPPTINQIEVHPFNTRTDITSFCASNNIVVEAYAPLARALRFRHPVVVQLSKKYNCTPAQLMVRWSLQKGYVPLPKSTRKERIEANANVGGFVIEEADIGKLDGCDERLVTDWDPTDAD